MDYKNIKKLDEEFSASLKNFTSYHAEMDRYVRYYNNSAFYVRKKGQIRQQSKVRANLLKVFADKNIHYTSPFPNMKVVPGGHTPEERESAGVEEKILLGTHRSNLSPLLQRQLAWDATNMSVALAETYFDRELRVMRTRRLDPRYCTWQYSNDNESRLIAFWVAFAMTKTEIKERFGVEPTETAVGTTLMQQQVGYRYDGQERYLVVRRVDDKVSVTWAGNKYITQPYNHGLGVFPVDIATPFNGGNADQRGAFFLEQLISLQAEFNETLRRRANIVRRLGNPAVWARGVHVRALEEVKRALAGDGGFVGLKNNGDLGVLSIPETSMLDNHLVSIFQQMKYLSGFGNASFGESVGANTSGDALSMYYAPTTRAIDYQSLSWEAMWESINHKILTGYRTQLKTGEKISLQGASPKGTFLGLYEDEDGLSNAKYERGLFSVTFTKEDISENCSSIVTAKSATPKDEIAYKRLIMEAASSGFISKITGYEEFGILNPQDELELLKQQEGDPVLNPEGTSKLLQAMPDEQAPAEDAFSPISLGVSNHEPQAVNPEVSADAVSA